MTRRHRGVTPSCGGRAAEAGDCDEGARPRSDEAAAGEVTRVVVASGPGVLHTGDYSGDLLIIAPSSPPHSSQGRGSTCSILLKIRLHEEV